MKRIFVILALILGAASINSLDMYFSPADAALPTPSDLIIQPITGFPVKIGSGQTVNNIVYSVKNISASNITVGFNNLTGDGVTYTTNCAILSAGNICQINVIFVAPVLSSGVTKQPYSHSFQVTGGARPVPYSFNSTIIANGTTISVKTNISLNSSATTSSTFTVTLTDLSTGTPTVFSSVPFGLYTLPTALAPDQYSVTVTPSTVTGTDARTYDAPLVFDQYINTQNNTVPIVYKMETLNSVSTDITAPNIGIATPTVTMSNAAHSYSHDQGAGIESYDNMYSGNYTVTASNYTGTDSKVYQATLNNPYTINPELVVSFTYTEVPTPSANYDWHTEHLSREIREANVFAIWWGGGSTTAPVHISTNPPINPFLNSNLNTYELSPVGIQSTAAVPLFPSYIAMGTVTEQDPAVTTQLEALKMDITNHYEGNGAGDRGCFWDQAGCGNAYTPQVNAIATQVTDVTASNAHTLIGGVVFYTIDYSDGATSILLDTTNDVNLTAHLYNLAYEVYAMQAKITAGTPMTLLLNPDSTVVFQNCTQYYCPIKWQSGLTDPSEKTPILANANLQADLFAALDRMQAQGYLGGGTVATLKAAYISDGIATPPSGTGRTVAGLPEIILTNSWLIKKLAPSLPWGYGVNFYDNNNPLMSPGGVAPAWETASADWIHKINHLGLSPSAITSGIQFEAQKFATFMTQMNLTSSGAYAPSYIFFDRYERDIIPSYDASGFLFNGVDWDTYIKYITDFDALANNIPIAIWQMPGASLQVQGDTFSGVLADTMVDWTFGHPALNNDFSNIATALNLNTQLFTTDMTNYVYFTKNVKAANVQEYLQLTPQ